MKRTYRVAQGRELRLPGDGRVISEGMEIEAPSTHHLALDMQALVEGGFLEEMPIEPVTCPACAERKVKSPPHFKKQETLAEHYRKEHGGLVVPDIEEV